MAERIRLTNEAATRGEEPPVWLVDPPVVVPAYWHRPEGQVSVHRFTAEAPKLVVDEVVGGRNAIGQVVKGHQPERLLTVEEQFARAEGRAQDERPSKIVDGFKTALRGKAQA
jgi:hypothetical protein